MRRLMANGRTIALAAGLGFIAVGAYQLTKKPTGPAPAPIPPGTGAAAATGAAVGATAGLGYTVTAQPSVTVRSGPGTGYPAIGQLPYGTSLAIVCQGYGSLVGSSAIWDQIASPFGVGWVSDWWVSTPGVGVFTPGLATCGGAPPPPTLAQTGGGTPPIASTLLLYPGLVISTACNSTNYVVDRGGPALFGVLQLSLVKRKVADAASWNALRVPYNCIRLVTPTVLNSLPNGNPLQIGLNITGGLPGVQQWQSGNPPSIVATNAGYCT